MEKASAIALMNFRQASVYRKSDKTYVTEADFNVQNYLEIHLQADFPDDGIIAEEEELIREPKSGSTYWVIDPIDGTASYINGMPTWGISIGIIKDDEPYAGFFYMPITGDFYSVENGSPVYLNGKVAQMRTPKALYRESLLLTQSSLHSKNYYIKRTYPGKVQGYGSNVTHLCYLATGSADAVLLEKVKIWDMVVGMAMLKSNDGVFQGINSKYPITYDTLISGVINEWPLIVGHREIISKFQAEIGFVPETIMGY